MMEYQFESMGPLLSIVVQVFMIAFALVLLAFAAMLAALPRIIAKDCNHRDNEVNTLKSPESLSTQINQIQERLDKLAKRTES